MIQEIITYIIVFAAFAWFGYGMYRFFIPKPNASACSGCSSCELKNELKDLIEAKKLGNSE